VALTAYRDVTGGTAQAPGTVAVLAGRNVDLAVSAGAVTGAAGQDFAVAGRFGRAQSVSAVNGSLTVQDNAPLLLAGNSRAGQDILVTAPSLSSEGVLGAGGSIRLRSTAGGFTQSSGTVAAGANLFLTASDD